MNAQTSWEAQTQELLDRTEQKLKELQDETDRKMQPYLDRRWALIEALEAYHELMGTETMQAAKALTNEDIQNRSQMDILKLIASRNAGLLVVRVAIKLMKEAHIFGNPDNADGMVYSILSRSKEFQRVGKGVYKLNEEHEEKRSSKPSIRRHSLPGLKEAIKTLKTKRPELTKDEVRDTLVRTGFDFQGRNPMRSVHMAWVNLGYSKTNEKPQVLVIDVPKDKVQLISGTVHVAPTKPIEANVE